MKILVTGASGFVGSHTTLTLRDAGHEVRGLVRRTPQGARYVAGVEYIDHVDVGDSDTLTPRMFAGIDAIIHLVGIIQEAKGGQTFERIHVIGTKNVVEAARRSGFTGRFIYMSAIGSREDSPAEYSRTKYAAEQIVTMSGLPFTILRPSIVLGSDGEFVEQMSALIKHGGLPVALPFPFIPVPGSGNNKFQPIYIDDLTACLVAALANEETARRLFEVGGATQLTFNNLLAGFARALNIKKPMLHAPIPLLKITAWGMEHVLSKPPVTRDQLANLGSDNITQSRAIYDVFDISPLSFEEILRKIFPKSV